MPFMISPAIPIIVDGRRLRNVKLQREYEEKVSDIVRKLCDKSRVGKAVFDEIAYAMNLRGQSYRFVTIEPQKEVTIDVITVGPRSPYESTGQTVVIWNNLTPELDTSRITFNDKLKTQASPQSVYVLFSPGFGPRAKRIYRGMWDLFDDHSTLLHELFHAVRFAQGKANGNPMEPAKAAAYKNKEEFYATVVQNIYRCEQGMHALRKNYNDGTQAGNYLSGTEIADEYNSELFDFVRSMSRFAHSVAQVQCKYNPIRDFIAKKPGWSGIPRTTRDPPQMPGMP